MFIAKLVVVISGCFLLSVVKAEGTAPSSRESAQSNTYVNDLLLQMKLFRTAQGSCRVKYSYLKPGEEFVTDFKFDFEKNQFRSEARYWDIIEVTTIAGGVRTNVKSSKGTAGSANAIVSSQQEMDCLNEMFPQILAQVEGKPLATFMSEAKQKKNASGDIEISCRGRVFTLDGTSRFLKKISIDSVDEMNFTFSCHRRVNGYIVPMEIRGAYLDKGVEAYFICSIDPQSFTLDRDVPANVFRHYIPIGASVYVEDTSERFINYEIDTEDAAKECEAIIKANIREVCKK